MRTRIFNNIEHQVLFEKQGYIVLPFLSQDEVQVLCNFFDELHPYIGESGFFSGTYNNDNDYKDKASAEIVSVFTRAYEELFTNYTPFGGSFLYKVPGESSELAIHQDWTIVDESQFVALNCWVPLCDVTMENGPIMVVPGSQYDNFNVIRCPTLPFFFSGEDAFMIKEVIPMEVPAGTAVILNQSVVHYSPPNKSNKVRKAITAGIKTKDAPMQFHYKVPDKDELEVFQMPENFFLRFDNFIHDIGQRPYLGESRGVIPYKLPRLEGKELYDKVKLMKERAGHKMATDYHGSRRPADRSLFSKVWKKFLTN
jgi:hypothetical protein